MPIGSMYGIFTYIWVIYGENVGKYSIHSFSIWGVQWLMRWDVTSISELCHNLVGLKRPSYGSFHGKIVTNPQHSTAAVSVGWRASKSFDVPSGYVKIANY